MISLGLQRMPDLPAAAEGDGVSLYERDFYAWTQDQSARLRQRARTDNARDVDWNNVAEEIESLGVSEKREIRSRLEVLIAHLLKWRFQADRRKHGWEDTIREQRRRLAMVVEDSPSLRAFPALALAGAYELAVLAAAKETGLPPAAFPDRCPFTVEDILDLAFLPEAA